MDQRIQIALARHAPTGVTLKHYQDFGLFDLWGAIRKLPPIRWIEPKAEFLRATGTCDIGPNSVARPVALNSGRKGVKASTGGQVGAKERHSITERQTTEKHGKKRSLDSEKTTTDGWARTIDLLIHSQTL